MLTAMGNVMREAYKRGWITTRDGNISVKKSGHLYVTPTAIRKYTTQVEQIVKMPIKSGELIIPEGVKPSIELDMHWLIHVDRGLKLGAVVHLHPTHTVAAMYKGLNLNELMGEFPELGRYTSVGHNVPAHPPGSDGLAQETAHEIKRYDIVGQDRHGVTAYGANPWDAFEHIERLEHICEIVLKSGKQVE